MCEELKQLLNNYARIRASEQESLQTLLRLKTGSDGVEVMSDGSSFHKSAPTTGNDRLPIVLRRMNGVVKRLVEADLSLCRLVTSATRVK